VWDLKELLGPSHRKRGLWWKRGVKLEKVLGLHLIRGRDVELVGERGEVRLGKISRV
jgi:hypothetical protein